MKLNYKKSDSFRSVNIDDIRIDITRNLDIQLSLYSDRSPEENVNGEQSIREVEIEAIMNLSTAKSLAESLQSVVAELEEVERVQKILETPPTPEEKARAKRIREEAFAMAKKAGPIPEEEAWAQFDALREEIVREAEEMKKIAKESN